MQPGVTRCDQVRLYVAHTCLLIVLSPATGQNLLSDPDLDPTP